MENLKIETIINDLKDSNLVTVHEVTKNGVIKTGVTLNNSDKIRATLYLEDIIKANPSTSATDIINELEEIRTNNKLDSEQMLSFADAIQNPQYI